MINMYTKYDIQDCDFYNFNETSFMMGVIYDNMIVTRTDRFSQSKQLQSGNREWTTTIEYVSSDGFVLSSFLILQGINHLVSWYIECDLLDSWVIKTSGNDWTNNDTALDWIKHFDKHTSVRRKGAYRMIVLDGHESHLSVQFKEFYKEKNIIILYLFIHSFYLI